MEAELQVLFDDLRTGGSGTSEEVSKKRNRFVELLNEVHKDDADHMPNPISCMEFPSFKRSKNVVDCYNGIARCFDDDLDIGGLGEGEGVLHYVSVAVACRLFKRRCRILRLLPSRICEIGLRRFRHQIRYADDVYSGQANGLREKHRAKFTGSDNADLNRLIARCALLKLCKQTQSAILPLPFEFCGQMPQHSSEFI